MNPALRQIALARTMAMALHKKGTSRGRRDGYVETLVAWIIEDLPPPYNGLEPDDPSPDRPHH